MINILLAEALKLRRSLALVVAVTPPLMILVLFTMMIQSGHAADNWEIYTYAIAAIWGYFLFPMSVTGLTALIAQVEHGTKTWTHVLALPTERWKIFLGKALITLLLLIGITGLVVLAVILSGYLGGLLSPEHALTGAPSWTLFLKLYGLMLAAGGLMVAIQWFLAMQYRSFAIPISVGMGGTFVALAATSSKSGLFFPWLMPVNVMATDPDRAMAAVLLGGLGGAVVLIVSIWWLSRRNWN